MTLSVSASKPVSDFEIERSFIVMLALDSNHMKAIRVKTKA